MRVSKRARPTDRQTESVVSKMMMINLSTFTSAISFYLFFLFKKSVYWSLMHCLTLYSIFSLSRLHSSQLLESEMTLSSFLPFLHHSLLPLTISDYFFSWVCQSYSSQEPDQMKPRLSARIAKFIVFLLTVFGREHLQSGDDLWKMLQKALAFSRVSQF